MKKFFIFASMVILAGACTKTTLDEGLVTQDTSQEGMRSDRLHFNSTQDLSAVIEQLKLCEEPDIHALPATRVSNLTANPTDFTSLRQHLIEQGLRSFTDAELAEIVADSLEYDPTDSLIADPYWMAVLNENREVQVGDMVYKYIDEGVLIYNAKTDYDVNAVITDRQLDALPLEPGERTTLTDPNGVDGELIGLDYGNNQGKQIVIGGQRPSGPSNPTPPAPMITNSLILSDGLRIPYDHIKFGVYAKGSKDETWFSSLWKNSLNVTVENKFNSRHRMKVRMYSADYIIYQAIGMTVRMQKRKFGIWWRKKAQEIRYGWSAIECKYTFSTSKFFDPPKMPDGTPQHEKYPSGMKGSFPFRNEKIVLFHLPLVNKDITTGNINSVLKSGLNNVVSTIDNWFEDDSNKGLLNNPRGLYTVNGEQEITVIFPHGEGQSRNDGREAVTWDSQWFSGELIAGFKLNSGGFSFKNIEWNPSVIQIERACIFGAVKYGDQWRACIIGTDNI